MQKQEPTEVYNDGACALCVASRDWAERRDLEGRLVFRDITDLADTQDLSVDRERLGREMLVRLPGGQIVGGFEGVLAVLRALPRWHTVAGLLALPPMRWVGPALYRMVARHRHLLRPTGPPRAC